MSLKQFFVPSPSVLLALLLAVCLWSTGAQQGGQVDAVHINIWKHRYPFHGGYGYGYYPFWGGYGGYGGYGGGYGGVGIGLGR